VEEHRIKSAREIAMEKIAGMGGLTPEEIARQKENEYQPVGEAIAGKYLTRAIREVDLPIELSKYRGNEGEIVRRALISSLCKAIGPGDAVVSRRAMQGVELLAGANRSLEEAKKELEEIISDCEQKTQQIYSALEEVERQRLEKLGISGSAIRPNVRANEDWQQERDKIQRGYDLRLSKLTDKLMQCAGAA